MKKNYKFEKIKSFVKNIREVFEYNFFRKQKFY